MTKIETALPSTDARIESKIRDLQSLRIDDLRSSWRDAFKKDVPNALTRDLLIRMLCWNIQERAFGGHDRATLKILDSHARGKGQPGNGQRPRYLKPGTEVVREYQGERHIVTVTTEGFRWRDGDYPSLTAIARIITGTSCNGPRFFGLRIGGEDNPAGAARQGSVDSQKPAPGHKNVRETRP